MTLGSAVQDTMNWESENELPATNPPTSEAPRRRASKKVPIAAHAR